MTDPTLSTPRAGGPSPDGPEGSSKGRSARSLTEIGLHNAMTGMLVTVVSVLVSLFLTPFVLGHLGKELYGIVAASDSVFTYLWIMNAGLARALRRFVTVNLHAGEHSKAQQHYEAGFWWAALARTGVLIAGITLAGPVCDFLNVPANLRTDAAWGVLLFVVAAVIRDLGTIFVVPIYATGRTSTISLIQICGAPTRLGIILLAFVLFHPSLALYGGALVVFQSLVCLTFGYFGNRARVVPRLLPPFTLGSSEIRRQLFSFGGLALVSQIASLLYVSMDNLLIGRFYGAGSVTEYSLGTRWAPLISGFLWSGVASITPLLTQLEARDEDLRGKRAVIRATAIASALGVPCCLVPCVVGDLFLVNWVGAEYAPSARYLIAMLAPMVIGISIAPIWSILVARGRIGWIAVADVVVAVANVAISLFLALTLGMGLMGFALGNTTALLLKNLVLRPLLGRRESGLPPVRMALVGLLRALAGGAPALLLLYLARPLYAGSLGAVFLAGILGGIFCLAGSSLVAVGPGQIRTLVQAALGRRRTGGL